MNKINLEKFKANLVEEIKHRIAVKYLHRAQRQLNNPHLSGYFKASASDNAAAAVATANTHINVANANAAAHVNAAAHLAAIIPNSDSNKDGEDYKAKLIEDICNVAKGIFNYIYDKSQYELKLKHQELAEKIIDYFSNQDGSINEKLIKAVVDIVVDARSAAFSNVENTQSNKNALYDYLARHILKAVKKAGNGDINSHDAGEIAASVGQIPSKKAKKEALTTLNGVKYTTEGLLFFKQPKYTNPVTTQATENHVSTPAKS